MPLTEYLYIDNKRLDSYFEQISDPVTYDKVPVWNTGLSITGPTAGTTQSRVGRPFTTHEKITKLVKHLEDTKAFSIQRPESLGTFEMPDFCLETWTAQKGQISLNEDVAGRSNLNLWVGERNRDALILLEDMSRGDGETYKYTSPFSSLYMLSMEFDSNGQKSFQFNHKNGGRIPNYASMVELLSETLGGRFGPERTIHTLFRYRTLYSDSVMGLSKSLLTMVGYPVFIAAVN